MNGKLSRLGGRLAVVGWVAVCATVVSVQVVQPSSAAEAGAPVGTPVRVSTQALRVSMSSWAASAEGDETAVTVVAGDRWQAVSDQDWLQVAGVEGGLVLTAGPNGGVMRTATVTVTSGRQTAAVAVVQGSAVPTPDDEDAASDVPENPAAGPAPGGPAVAGPAAAKPLLPGPPPDFNDPANVRSTVSLVPGSPLRVTGYIVDTAQSDYAMLYVVQGIFATKAGEERSDIGHRLVADRYDPVVGYHGYLYDLPATSAKGDPLIGACVMYLNVAWRDDVGCVYVAK